MAKINRDELEAFEKTRNLNEELLQSLAELKRGEWARKTEFIPQPDGSVRRIITRQDGSVEKDQLIPPHKAEVLTARAATGLSQSAFQNCLAFLPVHFRNGSRVENHHPVPLQPFLK